MNVINNKVVYVWYNVDTDYIFYVGEGTEKRANETKIGRRNKLFVDYIKTGFLFDFSLYGFKRTTITVASFYYFQPVSSFVYSIY